MEELAKLEAEKGNPAGISAIIIGFPPIKF